MVALYIPAQKQQLKTVIVYVVQKLTIEMEGEDIWTCGDPSLVFPLMCSCGGSACA